MKYFSTLPSRDRQGAKLLRLSRNAPRLVPTTPSRGRSSDERFLSNVASQMNLAEVAKRAGVSTATVSRVLNQASVVRNSTRQRVMRAVSELNYHPNLHARSLAKGASRTIGMIASNLQNPFFFDIFRALEADANTHGYEVVAANTDYNSEHLVRCVRLMIGRRVAGLAVIVSEMDPDLISELAASKLRVVF